MLMSHVSSIHTQGPGCYKLRTYFPLFTYLVRIIHVDPNIFTDNISPVNFLHSLIFIAKF